eukprot:GILK01009309.1.p1 GENE.GILK01009309.1~~GILK01009309.1.p1  ORF type:complete len:537 (+),score=37.54 GILK01009309.1:31-1611(+)
MSSHVAVPSMARASLGNFRPPVWAPDSSAKSCMSCGTSFGLGVRKHHCRYCGFVICGKCSKYQLQLPFGEPNKRERVCRLCVTQMSSNLAAGDNTPPPLSTGNEGRVHVVLMEAQDVPVQEGTSPLQLYAAVYLGTARVVTASSVKPYWNERVSFDISGVDLDMKLEVCQHTSVGEVVAGTVSVPLSVLQHTYVHHQWFPLTNIDGSTSGRIRVKVFYYFYTSDSRRYSTVAVQKASPIWQLLESLDYLLSLATPVQIYLTQLRAITEWIHPVRSGIITLIFWWTCFHPSWSLVVLFASLFGCYLYRYVSTRVRQAHAQLADSALRAPTETDGVPTDVTSVSNQSPTHNGRSSGLKRRLNAYLKKGRIIDAASSVAAAAGGQALGLIKDVARSVKRRTTNKPVDGNDKMLDEFTRSQLYRILDTVFCSGDIGSMPSLSSAPLVAAAHSEMTRITKLSMMLLRIVDTNDLALLSTILTVLGTGLILSMCLPIRYFMMLLVALPFFRHCEPIKRALQLAGIHSARSSS